MSLGLGIFLSSLVLAVVILYGLTKDRWGWRLMLKRTALTFLVLAAIIGGVYFWNQLPVTVTPQTEYAGIRIGMTPDEVMYIKGFPPTVFGEPRDDGDWKGFQPAIETKDLEKGKRVQDYRDWSYGPPNSRIDIKFNEAKDAVIAVQCYSGDRLGSCPSIAGVTDGDSEKEVIRRLGNPDTSRIEGVTKTMAYRNLGITLKLEKERVYLLAVHDRK
jgi:hypothetical protein